MGSGVSGCGGPGPAAPGSILAEHFYSEGLLPAMGAEGQAAEHSEGGGGHCLQDTLTEARTTLWFPLTNGHRGGEEELRAPRSPGL